MKKDIQKIAVLGAGIMGSRLACLFANMGIEVLLLDIAPDRLNDQEEKAGLALDDQRVKNRIVNDALQGSYKTNPKPLYHQKFQQLIKTGNFKDNMPDIATCDWVLEAVSEKIDIKKAVYDQVEACRKPGTLITTNTSGIPIGFLTQGRSADFKQHFCGTHFFNPPRYLRLLELIPSADTDPEVLDFLNYFGRKVLGKKTVICNDTPAFIANRIGVFSTLYNYHVMPKLNLTVEAIDKLTGPVIGRPKSATFRTSDLVGLDTLVHVANGLAEHCPNDEAKDMFQVPDYILKMIEQNLLGDKSGQGFYKKIKNEQGKSEIRSLNISTFEYAERSKVKFPSLELAKTITDPAQQLKALLAAKDTAGEYYRGMFCNLFAYVSNRIPEITDALYKIDDALEAGFGWSDGPFATWDKIGLASSIQYMEKEHLKPAPWVYEMIAAGHTRFYKVEAGQKCYYDIAEKTYKPIPGTEDLLFLDAIKISQTVWKNDDASVVDLGDGILNVEFHSKMNSLGAGIFQALNKAVDLAEEKYKGIVIYNDGPNFSAGANIGVIFMLAAEQEYDELDMVIRQFQQMMMRLRYCRVPVVAATQGMVLGGGCELCMHTDKVIAHAETYMGLVEMGVGVIPAGGGTKEFALRLSDGLAPGDIRMNRFTEALKTIAQAKVSSSAHEAFDLGYLLAEKDEIIIDRDNQLKYAKESALLMASKPYRPPVPKKIKIMGNEGLGIVLAGAETFAAGHYMTEYERTITEKLGYVLAGANISGVLTEVSEQYLLDLERQAFLWLCQQRKTLERLESMLNKGKPLRN